ncbi:MAG: TetR/AcrR family transcriptional regulator [Stackebrandtia sp.]
MARPRSDTRERLVAATSKLLREQGYHGTGMSQIVAESGAPRGSVYFLFPGGKEELAVEAVAASAAEFAEQLRSAASAPDVAGFASLLIGHLAEELRESQFTSGCPITTVTLEAAPASPSITDACRRAYDSWLDVIEEIAVGYGVPADSARALAVFGLTAVEGALVLCRAARDTGALETVEPLLTETLTRAADSGPN